MNKSFIYLMVGVFVGFSLTIFFSKGKEIVVKDDKEIKILLDKNAKLAVLNDSIQKRIGEVQDSLEIKYKGKIDSLNNDYVTKIHNIKNLSIDEHIELFSKLLSEKDTLK